MMKEQKMTSFGVYGLGVRGFKAYAQDLAQEECEIEYNGWLCEARSVIDGRLVASWNYKKDTLKEAGSSWIHIG